MSFQCLRRIGIGTLGFLRGTRHTSMYSHPLPPPPPSFHVPGVKFQKNSRAMPPKWLHLRFCPMSMPCSSRSSEARTSNCRPEPKRSLKMAGTLNEEGRDVGNFGSGRLEHVGLHSASAICTGYTTCLSPLLSSGRRLPSHKVRLLLLSTLPYRQLVDWIQAAHRQDGLRQLFLADPHRVGPRPSQGPPGVGRTAGVHRGIDRRRVECAEECIRTFGFGFQL